MYGRLVRGTQAQRDQALQLVRSLYRKLEGREDPLLGVYRFARAQDDAVLRDNLEALARAMFGESGGVYGRSQIRTHQPALSFVERRVPAPAVRRPPTVRVAPAPVSRRRRGR